GSGGLGRNQRPADPYESVRECERSALSGTGNSRNFHGRFQQYDHRCLTFVRKYRAGSRKSVPSQTLSTLGNVSLAAAGLNVITATLNGIQIWKGSVYIPAAAANVAEYWKDELDF